MRNTTPKVSVIVPIQNAGVRLTACLDTLINQTLQSLEIVLVLDCPTDGSDETAKEYAQRDERIKIIENKTNQHIGKSRNIGLLASTGKFIGFSDHDDYRELTMYEELYNCIQSSNSDIVLGASVSVGDHIEYTHFPSTIANTDLREFALIDLIRGGNDITLTPIATNIHPNLYKRDFLIKKNILFVDSLIYTPEDRIFQIMCLYYAHSVCSFPKPLYYHVAHSESTGQSQQYKSYQSRTNGKMQVYEFLKSKRCYEKYESYFLTATKKEFTNSAIAVFYSTKSIFQLIKALNRLKSFPFCKKAYREGDYSIKKYRLGGRLFRKAISFFMQF